MLEPLLKIDDIMRLFQVSRVSVYRWIALARKGEGRFPLPIFGYRQKRCWNRDDVESFVKHNRLAMGKQGVNNINKQEGEVE